MFTTLFNIFITAQHEAVESCCSTTYREWWNGATAGQSSEIRAPPNLGKEIEESVHPYCGMYGVKGVGLDEGGGVTMRTHFFFDHFLQMADGRVCCHSYFEEEGMVGHVSRVAQVRKLDDEITSHRPQVEITSHRPQGEAEQNIT